MFLMLLRGLYDESQLVLQNSITLQLCWGNFSVFVAYLSSFSHYINPTHFQLTGGVVFNIFFV